MKGFLVLIIIVLLLIVGGWLVFDFGNDSATVRIDTDKIKEDTGQLMNRSEEAFENAGGSMERAADNTEQNLAPDPRPID